ncbi:MAG: RluA family pseudouridine synthase [Pyrinomonadaceae bacterium]|nr:RluA family pseudouridine synthase [Pyrinomonadaceae bacterium]
MNEACASNIDPTIPIDQDAETLVFEVSAEAGSRLDANLAARLEDRSRTSIKRLIEDGDVLVDGRNAKPAHKLRMGERVEVDLAAVPISLTEFLPENIPLEIIYEDDCLIVVNKPAGLVVHPGAGVPRGTLANALAYHFQQLSTRGGGERPGIVHRLDRDTSGLIVVAKTEIAHEKLAEQFRTREVFKSYVALVHGHVPNETGRIDQPVGRDSRHRTRMWVVRGGRPALTLYRVRRRYERMTLLDVEIKTGRTHQIRVHLAWLKHPVVGDKLYGMGRDEGVPDVRLRIAISKLNRQFLHAEQLGFRHPLTGEQVHFTAPLPQDLTEFLATLE